MAKKKVAKKKIAKKKVAKKKVAKKKVAKKKVAKKKSSKSTKLSREEALSKYKEKIAKEEDEQKVVPTPEQAPENSYTESNEEETANEAELTKNLEENGYEPNAKPADPP
ncbi:hypothetical protein OAK75_14080, partial [Bacteriovoracales bacterium]|nr:hypothetical protein [Bacteriovoracales bacterium]